MYHVINIRHGNVFHTGDGLFSEKLLILYT